jgi:hypothetical protein
MFQDRSLSVQRGFGCHLVSESDYTLQCVMTAELKLLRAEFVMILLFTRRDCVSAVTVHISPNVCFIGCLAVGGGTLLHAFALM